MDLAISVFLLARAWLSHWALRNSCLFCLRTISLEQPGGRARVLRKRNTDASYIPSCNDSLSNLTSFALKSIPYKKCKKAQFHKANFAILNLEDKASVSPVALLRCFWTFFLHSPPLPSSPPSSLGAPATQYPSSPHLDNSSSPSHLRTHKCAGIPRIYRSRRSPLLASPSPSPSRAA